MRVRVPHMPGETPQSLMSRLAARNGMRLGELASDMRLSPSRVAAGDDAALETLAGLAGVEPRDLRRDGFRKEPGVWTFRGETLSHHMRRRSRMYVCARCIADDVGGADLRQDEAAFGRAVWLIDQVRTCPRHAVALTPSPVPGLDGIYTHDFVSRARPVLDDLARHVDEAIERPVSHFERYLLARLDGSSNETWLDAVAFHVVVTTCEWVGAVALYGKGAPLRHLSEDQRHSAGDAGFAVLEEGEKGLAAFFEAMRTLVAPAKANTDGQKLLGHFWDLLLRKKEDPAFEPVREVVAAQMVASKPVASGKNVLGVPTPKRVLHSIRTGSLETGVHQHTLRNVLSREGLLPDGHEGLSGAFVTLEAEDIASVLSRLKTSMSYKDAAAYLNAPRHPAWALYKAGLIAPRARADRGSHSSKLYLEFAREDLDAFLDALLSGSEECDQRAPGVVGIQRAALENCCSTNEVARLILERRLGWVGRLRFERGFMSILVRSNDVARLVRGAEPEGLVESSVRHRLRAHEKSVPVLLEEGRLAVITARHPRTRAVRRYVTFDSLERFEATFASLTMRASELGMPPNRLKVKLMKLAIEPALPPEMFYSAFYRRSDLPDRL